MKIINYITIILVFTLLFLVGCKSNSQKQMSLEGKENVVLTGNVTISPTEKLIGGDKDSHGCLIGAGYSWCESKGKCLRIWEEPCNKLITFAECKEKNGIEFDAKAKCNSGYNNLGQIIERKTICCVPK